MEQEEEAERKKGVRVRDMSEKETRRNETLSSDTLFLEGGGRGKRWRK